MTGSQTHALPPSPARPTPDRRRPSFGRDLWILSFANFLFALGLGLYFQLLGVYALNLGAPASMIGVMWWIMLVVTALGFIPGSWAADRFKLKTVIVSVWWITVPTAISFALAPSWPWLIPGYVLSGLYMANNTAFKAYVMLKSEPALAARNISYVLASYPLGLTIAPLAGGLIADRTSMRVVFVIAAFVYALSSTAVMFIRDTPYHAAGQSWRLSDLTSNRSFRRVFAFFLVGFLAVYLAQPFVLPYLKLVHHQSYAALGVFAAVGALGGSLITMLMGRATGIFGARFGIGGVLLSLMVGAILLLTGWAPPIWGLAVFFYGAFDSFRFIAAGIVGRTFGSVPPTWGYTVFDVSMTLGPMATGPLIGGLLFGIAYGLPFIVVTGMVALLLAALVFIPPATRSARGTAQQPPSGVD